ncbi:MAG: dTDP-4-dehydrorhamnose 3,5-epimerase [Gammaproteobacteria bacterium]|jgi:dTDP-4-dehydrorhamnose 3,5-epimerase
MKASPQVIPEIILFEPNVFSDERGFFFESFNQKVFEETTALSQTFIQDNHSKSTKGVLRGLHYQLPPKAQGKLVRVIEGEVFDVVVDVRKSSPTYSHWLGEILTAENKKQLWIPEGFAHGFVTLSETAEVLYKTTDYYAPEYEQCIRWDDPDIGIEWPIVDLPSCSAKDLNGVSLKQAEVFV